jgi:hypothetical protein
MGGRDMKDITLKEAGVLYCHNYKKGSICIVCRKYIYNGLHLLKPTAYPITTDK